MENFAAIDFETANEQRTSVCSVGVVIVRDGEIVDNYYSLISSRTREYYTYLEYACTWSDPGRYGLCTCFSDSMAGNRASYRGTDISGT